ncbi:DUF6214 family protein [Streptomyces sp. NBC_01525]|uniref:DUF6214 family protein n=1 Tax=Streptomyces sp. NBC_01525 TaxID=2903893 RepID=UPI003864B090
MRGDWPAWELRGHGSAAPSREGADGLPDGDGPLETADAAPSRLDPLEPWVSARLTFPDGARIDVLVTVEDDGITVEDLRADPPLPLSGLATLAHWIEGPLDDACRIATGRTRRPRPVPAPAADPSAAGGPYDGGARGSGGMSPAEGEPSAGGAVPSIGPGAGPSADRAPDPAAEPAAAQATDRVAESATGPATGPAAAPTAEQATPPVAERAAEPTAATGSPAAPAEARTAATGSPAAPAEARIADPDAAPATEPSAAPETDTPDATDPAPSPPRADPSAAVTEPAAAEGWAMWGRGGDRSKVVADAYREAQREGRDPVEAVMSATGRGRRRALRLIAGARDAGLLSPRHHRR